MYHVHCVSPVLFFQAAAVCINKFTKIWIEKGQSQNRAVSGKVSKVANAFKFKSSTAEILEY